MCTMGGNATVKCSLLAETVMLRAKCRLIYAYVSRMEEEGTQHHRIQRAFGSVPIQDDADGATGSSVIPRLTGVGQEEDGARNRGSEAHSPWQAKRFATNKEGLCY